jgi:hypothetical protein
MRCPSGGNGVALGESAMSEARANTMSRRTRDRRFGRALFAGGHETEMALGQG